MIALLISMAQKQDLGSMQVCASSTSGVSNGSSEERGGSTCRGMQKHAGKITSVPVIPLVLLPS